MERSCSPRDERSLDNRRSQDMIKRRKKERKGKENERMYMISSK